jgi:hypothetical protein
VPLRLWVGITIVSTLLLAWGAAGAATPERAAFKVTLTGTLTKDWTVTRTAEGEECDEITTTTGRWSMTLASRRASRVVISAPAGRRRALKISPSLLRSLAGSAAQGGSFRIDMRGPRCVRSIRRIECTGRRAAFRGASARLTSPRAGVARFAPLQGVRAARTLGSACPDEPPDIRALRTDLRLADGPLSASDVFDRGVSRFFSTGNSRQVTTIEGDYDGRAVERVRWTLTFMRLR